MEQTCNLPVRVLTVCGADGKMQPLRFQLEDEKHQVQTVAIEQIVSVREVQYVGIEALVFLCRAEFGGGRRLFELRYTIRTHRWVLLRMFH